MIIAMVVPPMNPKITERAISGIKVMRIAEMPLTRIAVIVSVFLPIMLINFPPTIPPMMPPAVPIDKIAPPMAGDTLKVSLKKETM